MDWAGEAWDEAMASLRRAAELKERCASRIASLDHSTCTTSKDDAPCYAVATAASAPAAMHPRASSYQLAVRC